MAGAKQSRKGSLREWLSNVLHPAQEKKVEAPKISSSASFPAQDTPATTVDTIELPEVEEEIVSLSQTEYKDRNALETVSIQEEPELTGIESSIEKPIQSIELSVDLQELLRENRFEPLREVLKEENITSVDQLKTAQLWVLLNRHDLYPIAERFSVFDYIQDRLNLEAEDNEDYEVDENTEAENVIEGDSGFEDEIPIAGEGNSSDEPETYDELPLVGFVEDELVAPEESPIIEETDVPTDPEKTPYYKRYKIDPDLYRSSLTIDCGFSVRVKNRLMSNKIGSVGDLLEQTDSSMLSISGFGANSLMELHNYFAKLAKNESAGTFPRTAANKLTNELDPFRDNLRAGDFSFTEGCEFTTSSQRTIAQFREAHVIIDRELIESVVNREPAALDIIGMLKEFVAVVDQENLCRAVMQRIPAARLLTLAEFVVRAYSSNDEVSSFFKSRIDGGATLEQFVYANSELVADKHPQMVKLLKWCEYDVIADIEEFFDNQLAKGNTKRIISGRVRGETLATIGDELGVTRERVRQIEAKVMRISKDWFHRNRVMYKIFLDLGFDDALSSEQIEEYIGQYGAEAVYILKENSGEHYFYSDRLGLFTFERPIDSGEIQDYVNSLPDYFTADKLDDIVAEGASKYGFRKDLLRSILLDSYRRTADTYHCSRLTLAKIYGETMKKYYPVGIHFDDDEINRFREHVQNDFGIDLSDKSTHSIGSIISRIGILCGRGRYRLKKDEPYLGEQLAKKIRDYVENSETPIMLISSIFTEFEEELREAGIDNRYYLQGVLKELFGDKWYFKKDYVTTDPSATSFYDAVGSFIAKATSPVSKEEIIRQFPGITDIVINLAVSGSDTINLFGSYINISRLTISGNDVQYLRSKVEKSLSEKEICYVRDLYNDIRMERPGFLSRNFITAGFGLYSVLEYYFGNDYNFSRPFIAREGSEIKSILSVLKEMVAEADLIEITDIISFASDHNYPIPSILDFANSCNDTHLMINAQEMATLEYIGVDEQIAKTVESAIRDEVREVMPISHLTCIGQLPVLKVEWNAWLVYSILKKWSKELDVGTSKPLFKITYPVVAPAGASLEIEFDESISHYGKIMSADDLDDIEDLIADYIAEELGDIDEF